MSIPEKWAIKIPQKGFNDVTEWFNKNSQNGARDYHTYDGFLHYPMFMALNNPHNLCHQDNRIEDGYTEITIEKFKKYVVNKEAPPVENAENYDYLIPILKQLNIT